jgi:Ca2+-binding RTX toxin-like protein
MRHRQGAAEGERTRCFPFAHRGSSRRRRFGLAVLSLSFLAVQFAVGAPPAFAGTCVLNGHIATATLAPGDNGGTAFVSRDVTNLTFMGQVCGALDNVDTLNIDMKNNFESLGINLQNGPIGPGFTHENDGTSEIEINARNVSGFFEIGVVGTTGVDHITVGERFSLQEGISLEQFNLNAGVEGSSPDVDVTTGGGSEIALSGLAGDDQLLAIGGHTILSHPPIKPMLFLDGPGADTMLGGSGNDTWSAGAYDQGDSFTGGGGVDTVDLHFRTAGLSISLNGSADDGEGCPGPGCENDNVAADVEGIETGSGSDTIVGGPGNEIVLPGQGANTVFGGPGADIVLASGSGPDVVHGGPGLDGVSYQNHASAVSVTLDGNANDGSGIEGDNIMPDVESLEGSPEGDQVRGSPGPNHLFGGQGNDLLFGLGGNDVLEGGGGLVTSAFQNDGSDQFSGGQGTDTVREDGHVGALRLSIDGLPNDRVVGDQSQGTDNIASDVENVVGGPGDDVISGSSANNRLTGGDGKDELSGLLGNDVLVPGPGIDSLVGGGGRDTAAFTGAAAAITANLEQGTADGDGHDVLSGMESLLGSANGDRLTGSSTANVLTGAAGDDVLKGLAGNDRLIGGPGDDTLAGGPGTDTCRQGPGTGPRTSCEH